ncbi:hypothetical protein TrCOL_g1908 [Triparma columacea]|uniref:Uncharacterized protein n=1 Tax=Triparma columacea TaxID=722753 RepID=A0A9W7FWM0_9STRA|nr:hypothetical protein TrCOL_g1908 [Triparma columacea]
MKMAFLPKFLKIMNPLELIPPEFHLVAMVATGVIGFLIILVLSGSLSKGGAKKTKGKKSKAKSTPAKSTPAKSTPAKSKRGSAKKGGLGTVDTPNGRRSSRIASRKE